MRLLLIEDDPQLGAAIHTSLRLKGFVTSLVNAGKPALHVIETDDCDAVILDLGLPDMDGMEVLRYLRRKKPSIPVLILTARNTTEDKVTGLDHGADDYITKPFDMEELFARLRVFERRLGTSTSSVIEVEGVCIDSASHTVAVDQRAIELSRKEFMVLKSLMENKGRILSREQLESKLYEWGEEVQSNAVEVHIHHLRKKLPPNFIKTIRGVGYTIRKS